MVKKFLLALLIALAVSAGAAAQDIEVERYNITARVDAAANALDVRAALALANLAQSSKPKLFLRLTRLAKVTSANVNGAPAQVETVEDRRIPTLNQVVLTPQAPIAPGAKVTAEVNYRIQVEENTPVISIYQGEVLMMPEGVWVPMPSTLYTLYGPTTAPFTLTVSAAGNLRVASAGAQKSDPANQAITFDQPLNSLPFIVASSFDQPVTADHGGVRVEFYAQVGLSVAREAIRRLDDEAARMVDFFTKLFGPPPAGATFRVISSARASNLAVPGALVVNQQVLRQDALDAGIVERLADGVARLWIDGRVRLRGAEPRSAQADRPAQKARSAALLRDSLPRFLALLYIEDRFGKEAARDAMTRLRWIYTPVAKSGADAELGLQTISLANYSPAVFGKGPLVLRLLSETAGRDKFIAALKEILAGPQTKIITTEDLRQSLVRAGGPEIDKIFQQWIESITEPDIVVGLPMAAATPGAQRVNIRNLGTGNVTVQLLAVTASGKQLISSVAVPSEDITSTEIQTAENITSVEVDPEKLIIQTDYDNDRKPARPSSLTLLNESILAFNKGAYAEAEGKLREGVRVDPRNSVLHAWLARALVAQNKTDEAVSEANAAIKSELPAGSALAWAHITLGQIALARNQAAEAVRHLRSAVIEAEEAPAQFAAREALVKAERAAGQAPPVEEAVRAFMTQLDSLIKQPSSDKLFSLVVKSNLKRFVQGLTVTPPTAWTTEILRVDQIDANRVAADVAISVKAGGRDQSGTALFILHRAGTGWMLEDVQLFNVK